MSAQPPLPELTPPGVVRLAVVLALGLLASAGAFWLSLQRHLPRDASYGVTLLPGFAGHLPDVDRIRLTGPGGVVVTLVRSAGHYTVAERDGYAADGRRVQRLLASLADLKIAERRPLDADTRAAAGLADGTRIDLSGRLPALTLTVGPRVGPENVYVVLGADATLLEAGPAPDIPVDPVAWLRHELVDISARRVTRLEYGVPPHSLILERAAAGEPYTWGGERAGTEPPAALAGSEPAPLAQLTLLDVRRASATRYDAHAAVETGDGLRVELSGRVDGPRRWLALDARCVPGRRAPSALADQACAYAATLAAQTRGYELLIPAARYDLIFWAPDAAPGR